MNVGTSILLGLGFILAMCLLYFVVCLLEYYIKRWLKKL